MQTALSVFDSIIIADVTAGTLRRRVRVLQSGRQRIWSWDRGRCVVKAMSVSWANPQSQFSSAASGQPMHFGVDCSNGYRSKPITHVGCSGRPGTRSERKQKVWPRLSAVTTIMPRLWPGALCMRMPGTTSAVLYQGQVSGFHQRIVVGVDVSDGVADMVLVGVLPFGARRSTARAETRGRRRSR